MSTSTAPQPVHTRPSPSAWFTSEIQQMMHGFGDCRKPLAETAALVEEIVHQQMTTLLYKAEEVAQTRGARYLGIEDFLFLLRKDKVKLKRLIHYMDVKDFRSSRNSTFEPEEELDAIDRQPQRKRRKICQEFLSSIDQTGELMKVLDDESVDDIKMERALRAELQSRTLDVLQYKEFCEARQTSFTPRYKTQRFKDWLMVGVTLEIKPNPLAIEVLSYLAYEIVAQVVDLTLLVRRDSEASHADPMSQAMPTVCINHDRGPSSLPGQSGFSGLRSPTSRHTSPTTSPPPTPTTPTTANILGLSGSFTSLGASGSSSSKKNKKRKKSGTFSSRELNMTSQALKVTEVQEAMRRYGQSIGPFADFSKLPLIPSHQRLLCC